MKTALVTGATRGVGRAIVEELVSKGFYIYAIARSQSDLKNLSRQYPRESVKCFALDLSSCEYIESIKSWIGEGETLDVLVNNAGGYDGGGKIEDLSLEDWERTFALNCYAPALLVKTTLDMLKRSESPSILNISSTSAIDAGIWNPHYSASKAALSNLTMSLAKSLGPEIRVNSLCLGPIETDGLTQQEDFSQEEVTRKLPMLRLGSTKEVARSAAFLVSEESSWITGSQFIVDGGRLCRA